MALLLPTDKVVTLDGMNQLLQTIKQDIEAASSSSGGGSSSYDDSLVKARLTELEKYVNDMNHWGEYEWLDKEIHTSGIVSEIDVTGTKFMEEFIANEEQFWDNLAAEKYELYIPRNCSVPIGYNYFDTMLPFEGSTKTYGSELGKVCKYNTLDTWNWNFDGEKIVLNQSTDSAYVLQIVKRK